MELNDGWRIKDFDPGAGEEAGAFDPRLDDGDWIPAVVPGDVHSALLAAEAVPDVFYDRNVEGVQWVEEREWWFRTDFEAPARPDDPDVRDLLTFDGLDLFATVYLNGEPLGSHHNMFRPATFDVTGRLLYARPNALALRFDPIRLRVGDPVPGQWGPYGVERALVRKAQYQFSWDWAPRLVNVGIWRSVRLGRWRTARLLFPHAATLRASEKHAVVAVTSDVEFWGEADGLEMEVRLRTDDVTIETAVSVRGNVGEACLEVPDPALWWPNGCGAQDLYDLEVSLRRGEELLDVFSDRVGLRTVHLDRTPESDEPGAESFTFVVNGNRIFAKGANWVPADSLNGRVDRARYEKLMRALVEANGNMLRVWGGGQYEKEDFYRLADEFGVLVWQDFMFACARYPDDPEFVAEVRAEAEYQVRRLRNHPCVVIWVGNNENDWIEDTTNWQAPGNDFPSKTLYHHHLPEIVGRLDPTRPYWPSSPYGGNDHNGEQAGDRHNWHVWHGGALPRRFGERPRHDPTPESVSFRHYLEDTARFISEFGIHASPMFETLSRNIPDEHLRMGSESLLFRNKDTPTDKGDALMRAHTGLPGDLAEYIDFSMITQAEGLKLGIEHYRRRKYHCSGTLFWQWNDCWPGISWSVLDYYGFPKAGYFFVKRAFAPVMASFAEEPDGSVGIWMTNDLLSPVHETLVWTRATFDGEILNRGEVSVAAPPDSSLLVATVPRDVLGNSDRCREFVWVRGGGGRVPDNRHFFAEIKDLVRARPEVSLELEEGQEALRAHLQCDRHAYFVHLIAAGEGTYYSDNWFDIYPGEARTVTIRQRDGIPTAPDSVRVEWR